VQLVRFVLVETLSGGNVGSIARALKNFGYTRLDLVSPRCDPLGPEACRMAVDAVDLLETATVHAELDLALAGAHQVVGTTGRRGKHRRPHRPLVELPAAVGAHAAASELAIVFGREDRGLTDAELDRCTHLVYLPSTDAYRSFNLAQAVLLVAYELTRSEVSSGSDVTADPPVDHEQREALFAHLEQALITVGFINHDGAEVIMRRMRRLLGRARMTAHEASMLRGLARQILWAADRAGLPRADGPDR
jgi:TrmH family RNA methyltransferase